MGSDERVFLGELRERMGVRPLGKNWDSAKFPGKNWDFGVKKLGS